MIIKAYKFIRDSFFLILKTILFLLLLAFAVKNNEIVHVQYYLGMHFEVPLVLVILVSFAVGAIIGGFANLGNILAKSSNINSLERKLKNTEQQLATSNK